MEENEKKEIEVISGDGSELNISPVSEHLKSLKPKSKEEQSKKKIVIPEVKKINIDNSDKKGENS